MAELVELRTQDSKTFEDAPGRFRKLLGHGLHYPGNGFEDVQLSFRALAGEDISDRANVIVRFVRSTRTIEMTNRAGLGLAIGPLPVGTEVVGPRTLQLTNGGITWTYTLRRSGMKLEAEVAVPRGPSTYSFPMSKIGVWPHTIDAEGNIRANNGALVLVRPTYEVTNPMTGQRVGFSRPVPGGWRIEGGNPTFDFDDSGIPAEQYPYYLDPTTTFNVAASGDDGYAFKFGAAYPPVTNSGNNSAAETLFCVRSKDTLNLYGGGANQYFISNGLMRWDTSSIPDNANILSANLIIRLITLTDGEGDRSFTADWYEPGTVGNEDYQEAAGTNAHAGTDLGSLVNGADNTLALMNLSNISKAGYSGIRTHVSGGTTELYNEAIFAAFDHATLTEPRLEVIYGLVLPGTMHQYRRRRI